MTTTKGHDMSANAATTARACSACGQPTSNIYSSGCCGAQVRWAVAPRTDKGYVNNLVVGMQRTRDELKAVINDLMDMHEAGVDGAYELAGRLHRTVGSISDDIDA